MQSYLFPDNTVFVNFAWINRLDLLHAYLGGRGRLTEAVEYEVNQSKRFVPNLGAIDVRTWFSVILEFDDDASRTAIENLRRHRFGGRESEPTQHLGESQTIYAVTTLAEYRGSVVVTDDRPAFLLAQRLGCVVDHTVGVLRRLSANGDISPQDAFELAVAIREAGPDGRALLEQITSARDFM